MKIAFRVDASLDMGTGHVMRCLTLARVLHEQGHDCIFLSREHPGNLISLIRNEFPLHVLPLGSDSDDELAHKKWLGATQAEDAQVCKLFLSSWYPDWLIVDHYALDYRWEEEIRPYCNHIMVIDDLADRFHRCDLLLDQNLGRQAADYLELVPENCVILTGPHYALLRPEFSALRDISLYRRNHFNLESILISMGGVDKLNVTSHVLKMLKKCNLPSNCRLNVVLGAKSPWIQQVRDTAKKMPWPTTVFVNCTDMADLMTKSDLSIGAAGSTSWERCCLGLPSIILALAENQRFISIELAKAGIAEVISLDTKDFETQLKEAINNYNIPGQLNDASHKAALVCDGLGADRVRRLLLEK